MKKVFMMMFAFLAVCACTKNDELELGDDVQESTVHISLVNDNSTKAIGQGHGVQAEDNNIKTLEFFVFRVNAGATDDGVLDGYKKFSGAELGNLTNLEIKTTTGKKIIYAVANSHRDNWNGVVTRKSFETQTSLLAKENIKDFTMVGSIEIQLQVATSVTFSVSRLVSRIKLNSLKTSFASGPYSGMQLSDVKVYLINAQAEKLIYNGSGNNVKVLNKSKFISADAGGCAMQGILNDNISGTISDAGYRVGHYFYCYENAIETQTQENSFTRLVIEGKLNGTVYYYPVSIKNLQRNCCYSVDVTILRPGSLDPNKEVEKGAALVSLNVVDWKVIPESVVEF